VPHWNVGALVESRMRESVRHVWCHQLPASIRRDESVQVSKDQVVGSLRLWW